LTFFITPFHYTDCFSVRQIGYGGTGAQQHAARGCGTKGDKDTFGQGCFPLCGGIRAQTPGYRIKIKECFLRSAALRGSVNGACRPQRKARSRHVRAGFGFEIILSQTRRERSE
jgi:hypothetical protein